MSRWLCLVVVVLGCGDQLREPPCVVRCEAGCPGGMTCSRGFCAAGGGTCEPAFEHIAAGGGFACALDQFHRAWCWGSNDHHQIDASDTPAIGRAVVAGDRQWDSITVGGGHACAIDDGELWCWGNNDRNQVTSTIVGDVTAPIRIEVPGQTVTWTRASAGFDDTCAIGDGQVFCWGAGEVGKLGNGSSDDIPRPRRIASDLDDWIDVAAGLRHTCAISKGHGTWCWGDGSSGQLGNDRFNVKLEPQAVSDLDDAVDIAVGLDTTCAVRATGELVCWGRAFEGALGDPDLVDPTGENHATPVVASALDGWVEVTAGERYACGRRDDGSMYCWGTADAGGLAGGLWRRTRAFTRLIADGATSIGVGWNGTVADRGFDEADLDLTCAIVGGEVQCWGDNRGGQLGQGGATRSSSPIEIDGARTWTRIAAGTSHVCGVSAGAAYCWGSIELGQVDGFAAGHQQLCTPEICDVATPQQIVDGVDDVSVGANHACARTGDRLQCWGDSRLGQCGEVAPGPVTPQDVSGTWASVSASANATCGVDITDPDAPETWCWGRAVTTHSPAPVPELDPTALAIGFGDTFGCQIAADGALACFGDESGGAFGNGAPGTCGDGACNAGETTATCAADCGNGPLTELGRAYLALSVGDAYACGIRPDGHVECWGDNRDGQCGTFDAQPVIEPVEVADLAACTKIATGHHHACALCGGQIRCWGDARHGELGPPIESPTIMPHAIDPPAGDAWATVSCGDRFTCGRTDAGKGYCWGTSVHGALGNGARGANLPVTVQLGDN